MCKFNHDGDCCNYESPQYKQSCRPLLCGCISPVSNADRIRAMSDEELAKLLLEADQGNFTVEVCDAKYCVPEQDECPHDCTAAVLKWLSSPAKEGEH